MPSENVRHTTLAQENSQKLAKSVRENELLQKQLFQSLLREVARRDDPTLVNEDGAGVWPPLAVEQHSHY